MRIDAIFSPFQIHILLGARTDARKPRSTNDDAQSSRTIYSAGVVPSFLSLLRPPCRPGFLRGRRVAPGAAAAAAVLP